MAETMLMAPRPSHVPEALTYDFSIVYSVDRLPPVWKA
jgi:hypothetical protein